MWGRKKEAPAPPSKKSGGGKKLMADMGLFGVDDLSELGIGCDDDDDDDCNDADLEAELRALQEEDDDDDVQPSKYRQNKKKKGNGKSSQSNLDRMIADSMKEVDDDEDISDTENPDLLRELEQLSMDDDDDESPPSVNKPQQQQRASHSDTASHGQAASHSQMGSYGQAGLSGQAGPYGQAGAVNGTGSVLPGNNSVYSPPPLAGATRVLPPQPTVIPRAAYPSINPAASQAPPTHPTPQVTPPTSVTRPAPPPPQKSLSVNDEDLSSLSPQDAEQYKMLSGRRNEYKMAALSSKKSGDEAAARRYMRTAKQFDNVLEALKSGKPVDLSQMPPPPPRSLLSSAPTSAPVPTPAPAQTAPIVSSPTQPPPVNLAVDRLQGGGTDGSGAEAAGDLTSDDKKKLFNAPESAGSVMEALQQRLVKYKESEEQAKQENNSSKVRRQGRIVKQYEDAIKLYKAGKPVDFEELPCPPGFPPIPLDNKGPSAAAAAVPPRAAAAAAAPRPAAAAAAGGAQAAAAATAKPTSPTKPGLQKQVSVVKSRAEQQCSFLEQRQSQFKQAALDAKSSGDLELAKKYLRMAKGFDQMIEASRAGLPVDLAQVPAAPASSGSTSGFEVIDMPAKSGGEGREGEGVGGDRNEMYKKLQSELQRQIKVSESNSSHFTKLGDVSSATKFDKMLQNSRKDLEALKNAYEHGDPVPRFHYETSSFSLVHPNYALERRTHSDTPQTGETATVKGSNCPEYNQSFKLEVNRKSRSFLRLLKSNKVVKFDLYYKRGFLKGDKLLGSVSFKLQPLEDKCVYHESFDLMDGRKAVGGKLEIKIRVRDPFVNKQVEAVTEKWLILDQFERSQPPQPVPQKKDVKPKPAARTSEGATGGAAAAAGGRFTASMSVLQFEKQQLDAQIQKYMGKLKTSEIDSLRQRGAQLDKQAEATKEALQKGGAPAYRAYIDSMTKLNASYAQEARTLAANPATSKDKLQLILTKRKLVEKEIESLQQKLRVS